MIAVVKAPAIWANFGVFRTDVDPKFQTLSEFNENLSFTSIQSLNLEKSTFCAQEVFEI